jgi:hypothetical protein
VPEGLAPPQISQISTAFLRMTISESFGATVLPDYGRSTVMSGERKPWNRNAAPRLPAGRHGIGAHLRSGTMMRGAPGGGAVGSLAPPEGELVPPTLPVVEGELPDCDPSVPVTGAGAPALPTPVPKFGVTVVLPGPVPPGTPVPDDGTCEAAPGCPGPDDDVPGDVAPAAPPAPLVPPPLP